MLGKHSGRHALAKRCEDLGFALDREQLDMVYQRFTALADRKKGLRNDEISALAQEVLEESQSPRAPATTTRIMNLKILLLPGDGIGAEVTSAAVEVLQPWPRNSDTRLS